MLMVMEARRRMDVIRPNHVGAAKYAFGVMIDVAKGRTIANRKAGRVVVMVISVENTNN